MTSAGYKTESEDYQPTESGGYQPTYDQAWWDHTACRRMCAGTYLDPKFRDRLLREVYNARNRRVAPSYGYDVTPVLAHAWFAWWLEMVQHAAVLLIFLFVSIIFPLDAIIAASILAIIYFAHRLVRLAIDFTAYYRGLESALEYHRLRTRRRVITFGMLASLAILVGAALLVLHSGYNKNGPPQWPAHGSLVGSTLLLIVTVIVVAAIAAARQIRISSLHTAGVHPLRPRGNRFDTIALQQYHPFTVYSGFKPFVGSGIDIRVWSFAQRLVQADITGGGKNEFGDVLPFTAQQLIASLRNTFDGLRNDQNPETRLPGLIVKDHVLLEGTHANPFRHVLGSAPESSVVENEIARVITNSSDVARHYLACQVPSWGGEVVTSIFVHVSLQGRILYLEYSVYALMPTCKEYRVIDEVGETGPASVARAMGKSILSFPAAVIAPWRLAQACGELLAAVRARKDSTLTASRYNIGSQVSAREMASGDANESYFQFRDIVHHSKVVERRLVTTVAEFLKARGVDTSEFLERTTAILNQGIINAGAGTVNFNAGVSFNQGANPPPSGGSGGG